MRRAGEKKELTYEDIITGKTSNIRSEIVDYHKLLVEKIVTPRLNTYSDLNYFKSIAQFSENKTALGGLTHQKGKFIGRQISFMSTTAKRATIKRHTLEHQTLDDKTVEYEYNRPFTPSYYKNYTIPNLQKSIQNRNLNKSTNFEKGQSMFNTLSRDKIFKLEEAKKTIPLTNDTGQGHSEINLNKRSSYVSQIGRSQAEISNLILSQDNSILLSFSKPLEKIKEEAQQKNKNLEQFIEKELTRLERQKERQESQSPESKLNLMKIISRKPERNWNEKLQQLKQKNKKIPEEVEDFPQNNNQKQSVMMSEQLNSFMKKGNKKQNEQIVNLEIKKSLLNSEYFFENKPDPKNLQSHNSIADFGRQVGRKSEMQTYSKLDGTYDKLFPEILANNHKISVNMSFHKMPGRAEHGLNLSKRRVPRLGERIFLQDHNQDYIRKNILQRKADLLLSKNIKQSTISFDNSLQNSRESFQLQNIELMKKIQYEDLQFQDKMKRDRRELRNREISGLSQDSDESIFDATQNSIISYNTLKVNKITNKDNKKDFPELRNKLISQSKTKKGQFNSFLLASNVLQVQPTMLSYYENGNHSAEIRFRKEPNYSFAKQEKIL